MAAGLQAVEAALAGAWSTGARDATASVGYDAKGRSDLLSGAGPMVVDRAL